ncbi:MAG TPA: dTDP-glucose 4,6-dehydratase [Gemmatimonadaceae bacterium]|nr:dTDP-glucose 4,6-dehydratase [Gemmatimonadaceae bacterium]
MSAHAPTCVLVTGAAGFIGSNFVRRLAGRHQGKIILLDALTYAGNMENLAGIVDDARVVFVRGDVCDEALLAELFGEERIDTVVHFAAESHVDRSIRSPDEFVRTNVVGTHALLKAARAAWAGAPGARRFHHVSTDEVYGSLDRDARAATETTAYAPSSPYAASKAAADHLVQAYHRTFDLPVVTTNCSNNFGPYQFPEKLIALATVRALLGEPIPVYGDGAQIRDWLFVEDHCAALEAVMRDGRNGETYNVSGTGGLTNREVLTRLCGAVDRLIANDRALAERFPGSPAAGGARSVELLTEVPDRAGHDRRYALDDAKLRRTLGVEPKMGLDQGLDATARWYAENEPWWRRVMDGSYREWVSTQYRHLVADGSEISAKGGTPLRHDVNTDPAKGGIIKH